MIFGCCYLGSGTQRGVRGFCGVRSTTLWKIEEEEYLHNGLRSHSSLPRAVQKNRWETIRGCSPKTAADAPTSYVHQRPSYHHLVWYLAENPCPPRVNLFPKIITRVVDDSWKDHPQCQGVNRSRITFKGKFPTRGHPFWKIKILTTTGTNHQIRKILCSMYTVHPTEPNSRRTSPLAPVSMITSETHAFTSILKLNKVCEYFLDRDHQVFWRCNTWPQFSLNLA